MNNPSQYSIEDRLYRAAQALEPEKDFSEDLWKQITKTPQNPKRQGIPLFGISLSKPLLAVPALAAILLALIMIFTPQQVVQAFQKLIAYLPGIGFIEDDSQTRYLAEPVLLTQEGVTLTVDQAVSDVNQLVIAYHIDNLPPGNDCVYDINQVRLPDGRSLHVMGGEGCGNGTSFVSRLEFQPLSEDIDHVDLFISNSALSQNCQAPAAWQVTLPFSSKPPKVNLLPVIENRLTAYSETTAENSQSEASAEPPLTQRADKNEDSRGIHLGIDAAVELEDGYLLKGSIQWDNPEWMGVYMTFKKTQVLDGEGKIIPIDTTSMSSEDNQWQFKVKGKSFSTPLTVEFQEAQIWAMSETGGSFTFDAGSSPQTGQEWKIEKKLSICGQEITIHSIRAVHEIYETEEDGMIIGSGEVIDAPSDKLPNAFRVTYSSDVGVSGLGLTLLDPTQTFSGAAQSEKERPGVSPRSTYINYFGDLPTGTLTFQLNGINFQLPGNWQASWQPAD